jgi:hypothetical protein
MKLKLTCGAAICAAAAMTGSLSAAQTATDNDLLLCFQATQGTGSTTNLYVNLGNFNTPDLSLNLNSDLTAIYGSNWNTDQYLTWSVLGTTGGVAGGGYPANTTFVTAPDPANNPSDPGTTSYQSEERSLIETLYSTYNQATAGNLSNSTSGSNTTSNSYTGEFGALTGANGFDQTIEQTGDVGNGSASADLWELYPGSVANQQQIDLNTFTLNGNGTFTAAVPEPSTWATMIAGVVSLLAFRRRRAQA